MKQTTKHHLYPWVLETLFYCKPLAENKSEVIGNVNSKHEFNAGYCLFVFLFVCLFFF